MKKRNISINEGERKRIYQPEGWPQRRESSYLLRKWPEEEVMANVEMYVLKRREMKMREINILLLKEGRLVQKTQKRRRETERSMACSSEREKPLEKYRREISLCLCRRLHEGCLPGLLLEVAREILHILKLTLLLSVSLLTCPIREASLQPDESYSEGVKWETMAIPPCLWRNVCEIYENTGSHIWYLSCYASTSLSYEG